MLTQEKIADLFINQRKKLHNTLINKMRDWQDIEDVIQDTFVEALRSAEKFREDATAETWVYSICLNVMRNDWKRKQIRDVHDLTPDFDDVAEDSRDPYDVASRIEMLELIMRAADKIPRDTYEAFNLVVIDGISYEDAATKLGIPIGTVRSRIFRVRETIQQSMA